MSDRSEYCSFCGKHEKEVERMIDGPKVAICNECIVLMHDDMLPRPARREPRSLDEFRREHGKEK